MGRNNKQTLAPKARHGHVPAPQKKRNDPGVPKFVAAAAKKEQIRAEQAAKERIRKGKGPRVANIAELSTTITQYDPDAELQQGSSTIDSTAPLDASIMIKDSSSKAFLSHLRKVIDQADVVIQVLDARDPLGGRSRFVEEEVRKREHQGKRLIAVVNKIDLVPRPTVENWLRYLRHDFPTLPFKSSTQTQRNNISSLHLPTQSASHTPTTTPTTALALGATPLIQLLKGYAKTLPTGQTLTVGVVGFPNVGKSSLINSLKRSRACGVAATPGKTRVVQEVSLDKGVKVLDCPGIVFDPAGEEPGMDEEQRRKKRAEVILRNCVKAELVEDPVAAVEVILSRVQAENLEKLYQIPPWESTTTFLVSIALVRGRLGKGGVPDLTASAVQVLRDWNSGKIAYYTIPPAVHHSSIAKPAPVRPMRDDDVSQSGDTDMVMDIGESGQAGDAAIVKEWAPAFDLGGLFTQADHEVWNGVGDVVDGMLPEEEEEVEMPVDDDDPYPVSAVERNFIDMMEQDERSNASLPLSKFSNASGTVTSSRSQLQRMFLPDEMAGFAIANPLSKKNLKKDAKKREKERRRAENPGGAAMDMDEY